MVQEGLVAEPSGDSHPLRGPAEDDILAEGRGARPLEPGVESPDAFEDVSVHEEVRRLEEPR